VRDIVCFFYYFVLASALLTFFILRRLIRRFNLLSFRLGRLTLTFHRASHIERRTKAASLPSLSSRHVHRLVPRARDVYLTVLSSGRSRIRRQTTG
jgi:hypothetical protein